MTVMRSRSWVLRALVSLIAFLAAGLGVLLVSAPRASADTGRPLPQAVWEYTGYDDLSPGDETTTIPVVDLAFLSDVAHAVEPGYVYDLLANSNATNTLDDAANLARYDPEYASRSILGQDYPGATGYGATPGGRTVSVHAAEQITYGAPGRPPTSLSYVDEILDTGTMVRYDPIRDTIQLRATQLPGRPFVVVSGGNPNHIVTAMVPK